MVSVPAAVQHEYQRELLSLRLRATAVQHAKIAAALADDAQRPLRTCFLESSELMLDAAKELAPLPAGRAAR